MEQLRDLHVLILGLGASGLAMARWCARHGAVVTVADTRESPPQRAVLQAEWPQVSFVGGAFGPELIEGTPIRAVFRSPGLAPEVVAPVTDAARAAGLWQGGELTLFSAALADLQSRLGYAPQVLAITGTNGKTTVTSLTGQLVARSGKTVRVAGNIGPTLLDTLGEALAQAEIDAKVQAQQEMGTAQDPQPGPAGLSGESAPANVHSQDTGPAVGALPMARALPEVWVLELSSFQLESSEGFEPSAAVVLNLTQDHLDWHGSMQAYAQAKARIFGKRALMVLNRDDPAVMAMLRPAGTGRAATQDDAGHESAMSAQPSGSSRAAMRARPSRSVDRDHVDFGSDMPQRPGDYGMESVHGMTWLVRAMVSDDTRKRRQDEAQPLHIQRLMPADALRIRGRHNALNALAALALAGSAGCPMAPMLYGLREYRGEPHRLEPLAIIEDVEYFDDSKGTNVGATVAALEGLGADRRLVVILGGDGKGQDFSPLRAPVARHVRAVVLMGRDAAAIREVLQDCGVPLQDAADLQQAVQDCARLARPGDAVLLSPACASLDMFRNYEHRAQVYRAAVQSLANAAGVSLEGAL